MKASKTTKAKAKACKQLYVEGDAQTPLSCALRGVTRGTLAHVLTQHPVPCSMRTALRINTRCAHPVLCVSYPAGMSADVRAAKDKAITWALPLPLAHGKDTDGMIDIAISGIHLRAKACRKVIQAILRGDLDKAF